MRSTLHLDSTILSKPRRSKDGFIVRADDKLSAFVELEREVLTVTFYLESIHADSEAV
jgi:hypothetical protein